MKRIILVILFVLCAEALRASMMFDPDLRWHTITTQHFRIHYHRGIEGPARKLAEISEKVHRRLAPHIGWEPFFRTDVVLVDNMDLANGFATPFPYNRIQIFLSRPELDSVLNNFDEWLEFVFVHEYTHILNLDSIAGIPSLTRYTIGRCCFPNMFLPIWQLEGNAVYQESRGTIFGRNNSSYTDMVMRAEVAAGTFKSIDEASHYPRRWPGGSVPYLYGGLFVEYLERKFGTGSFSKVMMENADNVLPYWVDYNMHCVYNRGADELYHEWKKETERNYKKQIDQIKRRPLSNFQLLTSSGYYTILPRFHPDGTSLFWVKMTGYDAPSLMKYSFSNKKVHALCTVHNPLSLSVAKTGKVMIADVEMYKSFSLYADIFEFERKYVQKSRKLRSIYLDVHPNGEELYYIKQEKNTYQLLKRDLKSSKDSVIISTTDIQLAFPRISPDGTKLACTMKDKNGFTDLVMLDMTEGKYYRLTKDRSFDLHPAWHPDGKKLIFSSDRSGVYNIYEADLASGKIGMLSNVIGGAFYPDVSPDGTKISFAYYDNKGFNIALMEYGTPVSTGNLEKSELPAEYFSRDEGTAVQEHTSSPYTMWTSVLPAFWLPVTYSEEVWEGKNDTAFGAETFGMDTLYRVIYRISASALSFQKRATVDTDFMLGYFYPNLMLSYYDERLFFGKDEFPWAGQHEYLLRRELERKFSAALHVPFMKYLSALEILAGYVYSDTRIDVSSLESVDTYHDRLAHAAAVIYYSNTQMYSYSISEENGVNLFLTADYYNSHLGSDYAFFKARGDFDVFLPGITTNQVVMFRVRGGICADAPEHIVPYSLGRYEKGKRGAPPDDEESWGLRGYPAGLIYGTRLATGTLEYRFPILQTDTGYSTFPIMFRDLWAVLFAETGDVWNPEFNSPRIRSSAGIELHSKITIGYMLDVSGFIGYARGFNSEGETQIYFGFAGIYEGAAKNPYKWFDFF